MLEILWAYKCTPKSLTRETPFNLVYDIEAMITIEISEPSLRRQNYIEDLNQESLSTSLDLLTKLREKPQIRNMVV